MAGTPALAQPFLALGQSPVGPLLDDREPDEWLDPPVELTMSDLPVPEAEVPDSVVNGYMPQMAGEEKPIYDSFATRFADEHHYCPQCGDTLFLGCPSCLEMSAGRPMRLFPSNSPFVACRQAPWFAAWKHAQGLLKPATSESWLFRPYSAGWFMGGMQGSTLVDDWLGQDGGFFGGYRMGWDFDEYWGCEMRFGFASLVLRDSDRARAAQLAQDLAAGYPPGDAYLSRFDQRRDSGIRLWDVDMLWYPYGDTYCRPYLMLGLGGARVDYMDRLSDRRIKSVFAMPFGLGVKYRLKDWCALRLELTDNLILGAGSGFNNLHNVSFTAGLEVRFGGTRTGYWPYSPGRHYW